MPHWGDLAQKRNQLNFSQSKDQLYAGDNAPNRLRPSARQRPNTCGLAGQCCELFGDYSKTLVRNS